MCSAFAASTAIYIEKAPVAVFVISNYLGYSFTLEAEEMDDIIMLG